MVNLRKSLGICSAISLLFLSGCEKVTQDKTPEIVKVVVSPDNPPMSYSDTTSGTEELKGFEIELIEFIFEKLGIKYEIASKEFSSIIASLESGDAIVAISGISQTDARSKSVLFSDVYLESHMRIFSKDQIHSSDMCSTFTGKKVAVQVGTILSDTIHKFQSENPNCNFEIVLFDNILSMVSAFNAGAVDIIVAESTTKIENKISITFFTQDYTDVKTSYSIAVSIKNEDLRNKINTVIKENADEISKIKEKYSLNN